MNQYDIGQAINCMANIANKDLARDLLGHGQPHVELQAHVRKKSVLAMYKLFVAFPQGLRLSFDKLKEKLNDEEASVVSCAVNGGGGRAGAGRVRGGRGGGKTRRQTDRQTDSHEDGDGSG